MAFLSFPDGRFLEVNPSFEDHCWHTKEMLLEKSLVETGFISRESWKEVTGPLKEGEWVGQAREMGPPPSGSVGLEFQSAFRLVEGEESLLLAVFGKDGPNRTDRRGPHQESEARYRAIFQQAVELLALLDMDGRVLSVNDTAMGYHPRRILLEEVRDRFFWDTPWWSDPKLRAEVRGYVRRAAGGEVVRFQSVQPRPNGTLGLLDNSIASVRDPSGAPAYLVVRGRDVTELVQARQALAESEERAQVLAECAFEGLVFLDPEDGRILDVNTRAQEMLGYAREEQRGRPIYEFLPSEFQDLARRKIASDDGAAYETILRRKDGSELPVEVLGRNITLNGRPVRVSAVRDLSDSKEAERRLRESEERYQALIAHIPDVTWIVSSGGTLEFLSPNVQRVLGYSPDLFLRGNARGWLSLVHAEDLPGLRRAGEGLFKLGLPFDTEFRLRHEDGRWIWVHSRAIDTFQRGGRTFTYGVFSDVTDRRSLETQLRQAQKLEELGTLASGIAHDFNNLLVPIMGYGDLLEEGVPHHHPAMKEMEDHLLSSAQRARDLVRQILIFSRKSEAKFKSVEAEQPVLDALRLLKASLPQSVRLKEGIHVDGARIWADETQIQQVVMNLCTNAVHAMGEGGGEMRVDLRPAGEIPPSPERELRENPEEWVCLTVQDTGGGIVPSDMNRIFDPFFTTKDPGQGTGLGLSMVHGIIRSHGGFIQVDSEPGLGTEFRVFLPLSIRQAEGLDSSDRVAVRGTERILVVDDDLSIRKTTVHLLESLGYQARALEAPSSVLSSVLSSVGSDSRGPDLVLIDYDMPGMTGTHLALKLLQARPGLPILLMTGTDTARVGDAERIGIRGKILKPFTGLELGAAIRAALDSEGPVTEDSNQAGVPEAENPLPTFHVGKGLRSRKLRRQDSNLRPSG